MRHLSLVLFVFISLPFISSAQVVQDNFEGTGTISNWFGDNCGMDNNFANPASQGINTSATVLKYTDTGALYANVRFDVAPNLNLSTQPTFSLKIYVPSSSLTGSQPNQISLKLQDGTLPSPWSTQCEIIKSLSTDQWQVVTFDFANDPYINLDPGSAVPTSRSDFNRVVLQINGENNTDEVIAYIDDFVFDGTLGTGGGSNFNQLVWSDEFDVDGALDATKWHHQTQLPNGSSWFNGELQHYTNRVDNSYVNGGSLYIVAKKETFTDQGHTKQYTSARLNSKFAFTYGRVEVRAKLPIGVGTWPAIWTLGKNITEPGGYWAASHGTTGWPACGEIDIMEHWGTNQNYVQSAMHTPSSFGNTSNLGGVALTNVTNTWHVYALEWTPTEMTFSVDGNVHYIYAPTPQDPNTWPFDADQYILLNVAIQNSIDPQFTESPMVIDYVRVYQDGPNSVSDPVDGHGSILYPNPVHDKLNIRLPESLEEAPVRVFSPLGQLLDESFSNSREVIQDWSSYPSGIYLVVIGQGQDRKTYKVFKS